MNISKLRPLSRLSNGGAKYKPHLIRQLSGKRGAGITIPKQFLIDNNINLQAEVFLFLDENGFLIVVPRDKIEQIKDDIVGEFPY